MPSFKSISYSLNSIVNDNTKRNNHDVKIFDKIMSIKKPALLCKKIFDEVHVKKASSNIPDFCR